MTDTQLKQLAALIEPLLEELARRIAHHHTTLATESESRDTSPWMGVERAAHYLDWPRQRLYKLSAQSAIPHYKHDGRLLFNRDELDRWLRSHAHGGRAGPA
jgi:excisionase family DNA binding protein